MKSAVVMEKWGRAGEGKNGVHLPVTASTKEIPVARWLPALKMYCPAAIYKCYSLFDGEVGGIN